MTTLQKAAVITIITSSIGAAIYEARQAGTLREQAEAARTEQIQLQQNYARTTNEVASLRAAESANLAAKASVSAELAKQSGEVARLRRALDDSNQPDFKGKLGVIYDLKRQLKQMRDKNIPEIEYMDDDAWLRMAQRPGFDSAMENEESIRRALAEVRRDAKGQFAGRIRSALQNFTKEHEGELPADILQLQPYLNAQPDRQAFTAISRPRFGPDGKFSGMSQADPQNLPPVDDTTLQRYEIVQTGNVSNLRPSQYVVREKAPMDSEFDLLIQIGLGGYFMSGVGKMQSAIGWSGGEPDFASLTPEQKDSYQRTIEARRKTESVRQGQPGSLPAGQQ